MKLALALDLGTTSISAVAVAEDGRIVAKAQRPNDATVEDLPRGWAEQDPQRLRTLAAAVLNELAAGLPGVPHCLGVTGQMHGTIVVDRDRRPLTNLITWQDRRANEPADADGGTWLERVLSRCDQTEIERTGCRLSAGYMGVTLFVLAVQDRLPADAHRAAFLADWIAAELCDGPIVTDRSNAAASGVYDLERDRWSDELLAAGGLPRSLFPDVLDSGAAIGELTPETAAETGLPAGLPVSGAIGDNQAAVLGSVPSGDPAIQINIGTGGQLNWPVERFVRVEGMETRYLPHGRYMLVGAGLAGGDSYAWINRTIARWLSAFGVDLSSDELYERLNRLAADVPEDADGLVCEPLFRGTRRRPHARGTFGGVTFENFTPGHVARSVLNGIAAGMHWFYENAGEQRPEHIARIIGSGNGLRKNPLLVATLERTFAREVWLPIHEEEAAYGTALLAGSMSGVWPDLHTAGRCIRLLSVRSTGRSSAR